MTETASSESEEPKRLLSVRTRWIALGVLLVLMVAGMFGYWQYRTYYPSTENAYIGSDIVRVAPEVNGVVKSVYVDTDEKVKEGDPLFDLDPTLYDAAVRGAKAQFDAAAAASGTAADELKNAADALDKQRRALDESLASYQKAKDDLKQGATTSDQLTQAEKSWRDALKAYDDAAKAFAKAQDADLTISTPTVKLRAAAAQLQKAIYDRMKTHVLAPGGGTVSTVNVRPGTTVGQGRPLFAIIEGDHWWVDANFKETDIARLHAGQDADIHLDMYPGVRFNGVVESISPGTGATFSVLPPENASGNWVKVTQRFPVRVRIPKPDQHKGMPLRVGATATVTVDTTEGDKGEGDGAAAAAAENGDAQAAQ
ncbi:Multidrug export protein EmrA [Methyloligella halotolerans]|uniref:Multidrug export protein EmrA n=1 Tax=Methyloligella halotolerans TaxID=1177755 RepID=A0A1E2RZL4_9HYPH|nr:HlyD family secretion protein [Methyloligella halotolerans]ODA67590.1 Multidrug export protein EmrA [Methyloligella halotolerans]